MNSHAAHHPRRIHHPSRRTPSAARKPDAAGDGAVANGRATKPTSPCNPSAARTVKKLRLSKALTLPEVTTVSEACRRMSARRVDAVLLTDAHGLLSGILTDKDVAIRVIAEGLRPEHTIVSKVMTRNPVYIAADMTATEALQKMLHGEFSHLPVVENGEVIAMLDITKFLYDAISRMEMVAEQGNAVAAAVEGVERQRGNNLSAPHAFIETIRERMFKPTLSTIITENTRVAVASPTDPVYVATTKMRDFHVNSVVVMTGSTPQGILTSKDVLLRVVASGLCPELTLVEKVMTAYPDCATLNTTILDALHTMHDGKFLHIPVLDRDGHIAACLDVLQLTHAAILMVEGGTEAVNDMANTMMHKFLDSAFALEPPEDDIDRHSEASLLMAAECAEGKYVTSPKIGNFAFKLEDQKGRMHRFYCGSENLVELVTVVADRIGIEGDRGHIQLLYKDDEGDRVLLTTDSDLAGAVFHAKSAGFKVLRLYIGDSDTKPDAVSSSIDPATAYEGWSPTLQIGIMVGVVALTSVGVMVYLKRANM